jgi:hypothetical protein|tara:strand:+ start:230 stop:334 length:105 start_codon:yes stop_codon:yes gene_type:complete
MLIVMALKRVVLNDSLQDRQNNKYQIRVLMSRWT